MGQSGYDRLVAKHDMACSGAGIENEIKSGKVGEEIPPELRVDGRDVGKGAKLNPVLSEKVCIEKLFSLALGQETRTMFPMVQTSLLSLFAEELSSSSLWCLTAVVRMNRTS